MTTAQLTAVRGAAASVGGDARIHTFDDFIIYNEPRRRDLYKLVARGLADRIRTFLSRN